MPSGRIKSFRWGRSKRGSFFLTAKDFHVFIFRGGATLRIRHSHNDWQHYQVILLRKNKVGAYEQKRTRTRRGQKFLSPPTLTVFEIAHWKTLNGTVTRTGLKSYIRVKVGPGGKQVKGAT